MEKMKCLRCGETMTGPAREKIQLGQTGLLFGDLPNLIAGALETDIYHCPKCGKLEFFSMDFQAEDADQLPQKECPACGRSIDFDYPKCPYCKQEFY